MRKKNKEKSEKKTVLKISFRWDFSGFVFRPVELRSLGSQWVLLCGRVSQSGRRGRPALSAECSKNDESQLWRFSQSNYSADCAEISQSKQQTLIARLNCHRSFAIEMATQAIRTHRAPCSIAPLEKSSRNKNRQHHENNSVWAIDHDVSAVSCDHNSGAETQ